MTIKGDSLAYRALKEELAPVMTELLRDMAELDRQNARRQFGATVDPRLAETVDKRVRELISALAEIVPANSELAQIWTEVTGA